jgi:histidyl-tRNA synthetase
VKVNSRKLLEAVRQAIGVADDGQWLTIMRAIDKLDRLGIAGVQSLLGEGRKDESGDFTKGAGLTADQISLVADCLSAQGNDGKEKLKSFARALGREGDGGFEEVHQMLLLCEEVGYAQDRIAFDQTVVRGLEYYTGPVYEVELLLETKDEKGRPVRFGSVGGGGRYDGLVSRFRGEPVPATGFSIGVSRLQAALTMLGKLDNKPQPGPVVVTVFGGAIAAYQKMVASLRNAGIRAELYLGNPKHSLGQQMKYADKRNSPCAIIQGTDERAAGKVQIKDLILGAGLTTIEDREEYLKKQSEAQTLVDESTLVDEVRKVLARHKVSWS